MSHNHLSQLHYSKAKKVTLIGALLDLVLGVAKIVFGWFGQSQALVADGVHSLSDLVTDALVLWAVKYGSQEADREHPYGHQRFQTIATVILGIGLTVVAIGLAFHAIEGLLSKQSAVTPDRLTLLVALVSIGSKEWIYRYTLRVARELKSALLEANAWHSRTDALSSVIVVIGILGALAGYPFLDSVAAVVVAIMVCKVGVSLVIDGIQELVDTGLDAAETEAIMTVMSAVEGVSGVENLRTRKMGALVVADATVSVPSYMSVSEGHRIAEEVERQVGQAGDDAIDLTVHIEPTDHTDHRGLPMRSELESEITSRWTMISSLPIDHMVLHYRKNNIDIDLVFISTDGHEQALLSDDVAKLRNAMAALPYMGDIRLYIEVV